MATAELMKTPLETLVNTPSQDVQAFFQGSLAIRGVIQERKESVLALPLRGAMPMYWAADGQIAAEEPAIAPQHVVEVPIGTYVYTATDGSPGIRSPSKRDKFKIIEGALDGVRGAAQEGGLTVIDEVQGGGTIIPFVQGSLRYARNHGIQEPVWVIAAEDTYAVNREKTSRYRRMRANQYDGIVTTCVQLPLIGCDRDALLDTVVFDGEGHLTDEVVHSYRVERNTAVEAVFRGLGSMMRNREVAYDDNFVRDTFALLSAGSSEVVSGRLEKWLEVLLDNAEKPTP